MKGIPFLGKSPFVLFCVTFVTVHLETNLRPPGFSLFLLVWGVLQNQPKGGGLFPLPLNVWEQLPNSCEVQGWFGNFGMNTCGNGPANMLYAESTCGFYHSVLAGSSRALDLSHLFRV